MDQLEIIQPGGAIKFHELDLRKGVTNIGRHPDNDVVIDSPEVPLFHALLYHSRKPYQIVVLDAETESRVCGQLLPPNVPRDLSNWDTIEISGHSIVLMESQAAGATPRPTSAPTVAPVSAPTYPVPAISPPRAAPAPMPAPPAYPTPAGGPPAPLPSPSMPSPRAEAGSQAPPYAASQPAPAELPQPAPGRAMQMQVMPPDQVDETIVAEISAREWTIDVEQTATCQVTIANGGDIVATFIVTVEGLDDTWYAVSPPQVNLNEGERTTVTIAFSAPRLSTSRAGPHHLAVVVTSPDYPGHVSRRGATLTINPYYEFSVGDLSPKQQTVPWRKRYGEIALPISNKSNSEMQYRLDGMDNERGCSFEFHMPDQETALVGQAELRLQPEEAQAVPVHITPLSRRTIAMRKHTYSFNITTTPLAGMQTPRSVMGQLQAAPLIGPGLILLMALCTIALVILIFRPVIYSFGGGPQEVAAGEEVTLRWRASQFSSLRLEPDLGTVPGPDGFKSIAPQDSVTYKLVAENLLTRLNPQWFGDSKPFPVTVEPVLPIIRAFYADKPDTLVGEQVTIAWEVLRADSLTLAVNGNPTSLLSTEHTGKRTFAATSGVTYLQLKSTNHYCSVDKSLEVKASVPTATPLPPPIIERFDVQPLVITMGQSVRIDWQVSGVQKVSIAPIPEALPPSGNLSHTPDQSPQRYTLTASNGQTETILYKEVIVNPAPTATPVPLPPKIEYFTGSPDTVVQGSSDANNIQLTWSVLGDYTNIEISGPDFGKVSNLDRQGDLTVSASKNTIFVLTAYNQDQTATQMVPIKVVEPSPTPPPSPTPSPTPLAPIIQFFGASDNSTPSNPSNVVPIGANKYEVVPGTNVKFSWTTQNAAKVTFFALGVNLGERPPTGEVTNLPPIVQGGQYQLTAENIVGVRVSSFLDIVIKQQTPPPPPTNVSGPLKPASAFTVTWNYADISRIVGFLIYRADAPFTTFGLLPGESLDAPIPNSQLYWVETDGKCGRAYYVTAVYENYTDAGKVRLQTSPSTSRYYTWPCATPTPKP